jgi:aryl-alcohol dehydrogenase-like predicted oxidoreductase
MEYVTLGRSGLKITGACLGAMNFGTSWFGVEEADARAVVDAFLDAGHNTIDTANLYGNGESEEIVGRAVRGRRDSVVLATKAAMPLGPGPNEGGLSRAHLTRALEGSLRRLGTDYVDLYQCHQPDPDTPIEETMATLDGFVRAGKVRYLGCSNFTASHLIEAQWAAQRAGSTPFVSLQPQYSLLSREIEAEILPACERHGLGTLIWGPLASGVLAGRYQRGVEPDPGSRAGRLLRMSDERAAEWIRRRLTDRNLAIAEEVGKVAAELGSTPAAVALAWVAGRPGVTSVIIGPRDVAQCVQNLAALELRLPPELLDRLTAATGPTPTPITGLD